MSASEQSNIAIISATTFLHVSNLSGSSKFQLCLYSLNIQANSAKLVETFNLSNVLSEYHKFTNIFSKTKAEILTSHYSYNLQINLKEGAQSLVGLIYFLSAFKQEALKKFIEENLNMDLIQPTFSLYSTLVLFIKKKDGLLCLCADFCSLNYISKKIAIHFHLSLIYSTHFGKLKCIQR